jgi:glycerol-1-phosphate dehydrogenase [NAD(P)+]
MHMKLDPLTDLLAGRYVDPESGELLGTSVRAVEIADDLDGREVELIDALGAGSSFAVLSDPDTSAALGARVERALASRFRVQRIMIGRRPHADDETAARIAAEVDTGVDAIISVGSGTISDLGKVVAFRRGCPHAVFPTAPSMNGFTSVSASITSGGLKRSIRVEAPTAVYVDLGVLAAAPPRLIRAGLGDSVCRSTAQADWLLAHLLLDQRYREAPFALLAGDEPGLLAESAALLAGDRAAMRRLARTLVLSGFGMTLCGGSYPASQGEHLISHYLDATAPPGSAPSLHGEQIGAAAVAMAALQGAVLADDRPPRLAPSTITRGDLVAHLGPALGDACWIELAPKLLDDARAEQLNDRLTARWDELRARIAAVSVSAAALHASLAAAGAPVGPRDLGVDDVRWADAIRHARAMRNRYTFLDLIGDAIHGGLG